MILIELYVPFDFQMNGDNILNALEVQVVHYTIQTSLFDIILAAFVRFSLLIIFYGIFAINHWSIIAVSLFIIEILLKFHRNSIEIPSKYFIVCSAFYSSSPRQRHVHF